MTTQKKTSTSVPALNDGHDAATAKQLTKLYKDAQNGMRRIVALGLFAWEVKELKLKHGQFGAWLAAHCPDLVRVDDLTGKPKPSTALSSYMDLTRGVLESMNFTVEKYLNHISNSRDAGICRGGKFLLLADKKLPEEARQLKTQICELVDGKTKRQLFMEFKQAEESETGKAKPKRGNLSGKGNPKAQRETAQQLEERARIEAIEIKAAEVTEWLAEHCDDKHLGMIDDAAFTALLESVAHAATYLRSVQAARAAARIANRGNKLVPISDDADPEPTHSGYVTGSGVLVVKPYDLTEEVEAAKSPRVVAVIRGIVANNYDHAVDEAKTRYREGNFQKTFAADQQGLPEKLRS